MEPFFAYDANYLIDNKAGIILDAEGTRANRIAEMAVTQTESPHAAPNGILAISDLSASRRKVWRVIGTSGSPGECRGAGQ